MSEAKQINDRITMYIIESQVIDYQETIIKSLMPESGFRRLGYLFSGKKRKEVLAEASAILLLYRWDLMTYHGMVSVTKDGLIAGLREDNMSLDKVIDMAEGEENSAIVQAMVTEEGFYERIKSSYESLSLPMDIPALKETLLGSH